MRRPTAVLAGTLLASLAAAFGAFVAEPFGIVRDVQAKRLRGAGAHDERFSAPDGATLHAFVLGPLSAAKPVVLLHGIGADATYWTGTALHLREGGRTAILLDAPGSGESEPPRSLEGYGLASRVGALEALVRALGLAAFDLVGHSLGGWTSARYALQRPEGLSRLVLVDSGGFSPLPEGGFATARAVLTPTTRDGARRLVDLLFFEKPFPVAGFTADAFLRTFRKPNVAKTLDVAREEDLLLGRRAELPPETAVIWGEKEALFPLADGRELAARIPRGRLLVVPGVGHDGPLEDPPAFYRALDAALADAAPAAGSR